MPRVLALFSFLLFFSSVTNGAAPVRLRILATTLPAYWFACAVAGDAADVEQLLPGRVGPHDVQFSAQDLKKIGQADLIVVNGLGLESWLKKTLARAAKDHAPRIASLAEGLPAKALIYRPTEIASPLQASTTVGADGETREYPNPHIWLDPNLAAHGVTNILKAFTRLDPDQSATFAQNARACFSRLSALDSELERALRPLHDAAFVTYHDAFPYFARRYQLRLIAVIEPVPDVPPSLRYLKKVFDAIRSNHARAIFSEPQFSPKLARQIARDLGIPLAELDPLETGSPRKDGYESGMRANASTLLKLLKQS